jgi:hypothetical protein
MSEPALEDRSTIPDGFLYYNGTDGIYRTPLKTSAPELVHACDEPHRYGFWVTDDGKWLQRRWRYVNLHTGKVVSAWRSGDKGGSAESPWWNHPDGGMGVWRYIKTDRYQTGIEGFHVVMTDDTVYFEDVQTLATGFTTDRTDLLPKGVDFSNMGGAAQRNISGNRIYGRLGEGGGSYCITIPDNGKGTATPDDIWFHDGPNLGGCAEAMTHDGAMVANNLPIMKLAPADCGDMYSQCIAPGHKGFTMVPFKEITAPVMEASAYFIGEGISSNWAPETMVDRNVAWPEKYNIIGYTFTNDNEYLFGRDVAATASGHYLIHWPTNRWWNLEPQAGKVWVWIDSPTAVAGRTGAAAGPRVARVPAPGVYDIRGRCFPGRHASSGVRIAPAMGGAQLMVPGRQANRER